MPRKRVWTEYDRNYQKARYRKDPDWRAAVNGRTIADRKKKIASDPRWKEVYYLRSKISQARGVLDRYMERVSKVEIRLLRFVERRDALLRQLQG